MSSSRFRPRPASRDACRIAAEVCFREGPLELFLCRKNTKEHESVVAADVDARDIHKALLAAGAKVGSPVKFVPKYEPAKGSKILVSIEYTKDKKTITVPARQWVRDTKTRKELSTDWVFGGSQFFPDPDGKDKPPLYAANGGDVICVSNFESAMLDLPIQSTQARRRTAIRGVHRSHSAARHKGHDHPGTCAEKK